MLDRFAPLAHLLRMFVEPALHGFENVLMLPSGDPTLLAGGAAVLDGAALAGVGPVAAQDQSIFLVRVMVGEPFTGLTKPIYGITTKLLGFGHQTADHGPTGPIW